MKGIREMAKGTPEPETPVYTPSYHGGKSRFTEDYPSTSSYLGEDAEYCDEYGIPKPEFQQMFNSYGILKEEYRKSTSYGNITRAQPKYGYRSDKITITMIIDVDLIGPCADDNSQMYNWEMANRKATEIAYDRLEALAGKNYESRYVLSFEITEGMFEYEATITLTPTKK